MAYTENHSFKSIYRQFFAPRVKTYESDFGGGVYDAWSKFESGLFIFTINCLLWSLIILSIRHLMS